MKEKASTRKHSGKKNLSCITHSSMLDVPGRMASTSQWLRPFSASSISVASCTWSQVLGWTPQPVCAYCPWQCLPSASVGTWPAEWDWGNPSPRLLACPCPVLGTAPAARPGAGMVAMPQLAIQASYPLTGHNLQVILASGIICRDFLHLQCVQGSESLLFGNGQPQS